MLPRPQPLVVTVDNQGRENIAMVDTRAAAGYLSHYLEPEYYGNLPTFSLPSPEFRNATFRCFQVQGNSMATAFHSGDWVIASYVDNWPQNIRNGYVYVVVTPYALLVKRVINRVLERQRIVIQSDNEEYPTEEIHASDVLELWYVKARISFKFPNTRFEPLRKVRELEADFLSLREEVAELRRTQNAPY